jgi:type I restriction enzyme S subunit
VIQLADADLARVRAILERLVPERDVLAFGSRARGDAKPTSDLDLAILGETPLTLSQRGELEEAFTESDLAMKVDVVDWATAGPAFRRLIERDGRLIRAACQRAS